jgi:hypothetical protein
MKLVGVTNAFALSLLVSGFLLAAPISSYGQEDRDQAKPAQQDESKPAQEQTHPAATKPAQDEPSKRQDDAKPAQQKENEDKASRDEDKAKQDDNKKQDDLKKQDDNKRDNRQEPGMTSGRQGTADHRGGQIPEEKFRASFGRQHTFVIHQPTAVSGQSRFQYGGFWFTLSDAWPTDWAYTDECYIDFIDGEYFLFDLAHPGVRLAVIVVS